LKEPPMEKRWIASLILFVALILGAGIYGTGLLAEHGRKRVEAEGRTDLSLIETHLSTELKILNGAVTAMAGSPWIVAALANPSPHRLEDAYNVVTRYNKALGASVTYILNKEGVAIAASNRGEKDSFVGQRYDFRPYFVKAMQGNPFSYFAVGVTSQKKGFYTSAPVRSPRGEVIGVAVMKKDLQDMQTFLAKYENCFLVSPQGVIFLSSRPDLALRALWPLTDEERKELSGTRQFGSGPFAPVLASPPADGTIISYEDEDFLVIRKPFGHTGWSLALLAPLEIVTIYRSMGILATVFLLVTTLGLLVFLYVKDTSAKALRQSEERFKQISETSQDWIWEVDGHARFTYSNCSVEDVLGYRVHEILGKPFVDFLPPDDRENVSRNIENILKKRRTIRRVRTRFLHRDGREVILETSGLPVEDGKGNFLGYRGLGRDVTQELQVLAALRDSEETFRTMTETAQDAVITMDDGGRITYWNHAAEQIFGYGRTEALGRNLHDLLAPERYRASHQASLPLFRETGAGAAVGKTLELFALRRDGGEFPVELSLSAVKIKGRWTALGILRDVTDRKKAEASLVQAKHEAEAASRAKSDFLAGMSHEIRTPMNAIIGMADLLQETNLNMDQDKYVSVLKNAGEHLLELINEILDLSKVEAGRIELQPAVFNLHEFMEKLCEEMAVRAFGKGLELTCRVDPQVPAFVEGDPVRLKQILVNLLGNAVKFTEQGSIAVEVRPTGPIGVVGEETEILFRVADTGIGIPEDKRGLIFENFTQADSSITRKYGGTGLGLAITKRLVELMGGKIGLESEEGKGSIFTFTARLIVREGKSEKEETKPTVELSNLRTIVVDDNEDNRLILHEILSLWGIETVCVDSGPRCLAEMQRQREAGTPYQLAILDYQMPGMDGLELAARIREEEAPAVTPIILLSSGFQREDMRTASQQHVFRYLFKPVKRTELKEAITAAVAGVPEAAQVKTPVEAPTAPPEEGRKDKPLRILLAEDNEDNRLLVWTYFKATPHRIDMAENGAEALEMFRERSYDLVLMDMQMPVMDGYTATAAIREWEAAKGSKRTPILALTAHALKEDEQKSLAAGCDGHLTKPIKKKELLAAVSCWGRQG